MIAALPDKKPKTFLHRLRSAWIGPRASLRYLLGVPVKETEIFAPLSGKRIALVGNARSLTEQGYGAEIDAADLVIRFNSASIPDQKSHGSRTDWIAAGIEINPAMLRERKVRYVVWTAKLRKLPDWMFGRPDIFIYPRSREATLATKIGKPPSSGMMIIEMLSRSQCRQVTLYGFDFFSSLSLSGTRSKADVPHDFDKEREIVHELIEKDSRFVLRKAER